MFGELRDFVFARVGQRAMRSIALRTFRHVHALALRFHLDRQTGGLSRAIERGIRGIDFLLRFMLFSILPTLVEIGLVRPDDLERIHATIARSRRSTHVSETPARFGCGCPVKGSSSARS